jgi:diguanylate cyclase (GGDEF)-like protein
MFQLTAYSLPSLVATALALVLLRRVWRQRAAPGGWPLSAMLAGIAWWSAGQVLGTSVTTLEGKFLTAQLQYPGIVLVPVAWLMFSLRYTGALRWLADHWPWLAVLPAVTLALAFSNDLHGWLWADAELVRRGDFVAWTIDYGPWFTVYTSYSYLAVGGGTLLLLSALLRSPWHRRRAAAMVGAPLLVLATNILYLLPASPVQWIDITPLGFALAGAVFTLALRGDVLDLVPLSREQVVQDMADAVFVVAQDGRVVDANPAAERLIRRPPGAGLGRLLTDLLPIPRDLLDTAPVGEDARPVDLVLRLEGRETAWRVALSDLLDPRGEVAGRVLIFHDHSDRWRAERELRATSEALADANRELERLTTLDPLTRVLSRRSFLRQADEEVIRARRHGRDLALVVIDVDNLAAINDLHGSESGDAVLAGAARLLEALRRDGDLLGRTGAGEFALLLPEASARRARDLAASIAQAVARSRFRSEAGEELDVSVRPGVAVLDAETERAETLLRHALEAGDGDGSRLSARA